ncbi:MAG: PD40 domain-containing protein [Bacteroidales bacterium]|nr:PD40 domain-containing protein [Bacteroidales bacterium]
MRSILLLLTALLLLNTTSAYCSFNSPNKKGPTDDQEDWIGAGLARAWVLYNNKDYYGALRIYRDLYQKAPNHAKLNFRIGVCFEGLNEADSAIYYLNRAVDRDTSITQNAYYYLGKAYKYNGNLDEAIENFYKYKNKTTRENSDVNRLLHQCETAKYMMENPVIAPIANMGTAINSEFVDASPSVTADEKTLVFTSRRPDNIGGKLCEFNEQYFDDIYISTWDDSAQKWGSAKNIGEPINTPSFDANLSISADGQYIFIYKNIEGVTGSGDIYVSKFDSDGKWSEPVPIDDKYINSSYFESSASITADGKTLYFVSERERGGMGFGDIWVSNKVAGVWQKPVNIGPVINTEYDEIGVYIHPDGKTLFFSSEGHNSMGMHDIFVSTLAEDGTWSKPVNLGYPINTTKDEIHFVLSASKNKAFISSNRKEGIGKLDIYEIDMSNYFNSYKELPAVLAESFNTEQMAIVKGSVVDSDTGKPLEAQIKITNSKTDEKIIVDSNTSGNYFLTLSADQKYEFTVVAKGYKSFSFKLKTPGLDTSGKISTTTKHIILNKQ